MPLVAEWSDWSQEDKDLFETFVILQTIDTHQTYTALKTGQFHESNPFYGHTLRWKKLYLQKR